MKRRKVSSGVEARKELAEGARKLAEAVSSTLGPYGQNWFLDPKIVTNDGVTVANEFHLPDELQNRGASALREAANKTVEQVGDGTTTAITLAWAIYQSLSELLSKGGLHIGRKPAELINQVKAEKDEIITKLKELATPIETEAQLIESAVVACEDKELGEMIGKAQWEFGKEGFLLARETAERASYFDRIEGILLDNSMVSSMLINNQERQTLEIADTAVIITGHAIKDPKSLEKIVQFLVNYGRKQVAVIASAFTPEVVLACQENINAGRFKIFPINAAYENMSEVMKDIAAVTGATYYEQESSRLDDIVLNGVGWASKIEVRRWESIVAGVKDEDSRLRIEKRLEELKKAHAASKSDFEKKGLDKRMAQLKNGFGIINIGSHSELERTRMLHKAEDAVHAVRAAFQEGTVAGAGLALKEISDSLPETYLLKKALRAPYEAIMLSAPEGFEVEPWVRDPVKVVRIAFENAVETAAAFASAGGVSTEEFPKRLDEIMGNKGV